MKRNLQLQNLQFTLNFQLGNFTFSLEKSSLNHCKFIENCKLKIKNL